MAIDHKLKHHYSTVKKILDNGYQVIPVDGNGVPCLKEWADVNLEFTSVDLKRWCHSFGVTNMALIPGRNNVCALDFDIDDPDLSKRLKRYLMKNHKGLIYRVCEPPRFAALFRAKGDLLGCSNGHSNSYKYDGAVNQIEFMGYNKLLTIHGMHRNRKKVYKWTKVGSPVITHVEDLIELDKSDIEKMFRLVARGFRKLKIKPVSQSNFTTQRENRPKEETMESVGLTRVYTEGEVEIILDSCNGDTRDGWIRAGMALHTQYDASKEGLHRWNQWSSEFDGYKGLEDCRVQWKSFRTGGGVTMRTLEKEVIQAKRKTAKDRLIKRADDDDDNDDNDNYEIDNDELTFDDMFQDGLESDEIKDIVARDVVEMSSKSNTSVLILSYDGGQDIMSDVSFRNRCKGVWVDGRKFDGRSNEWVDTIIPVYDYWYGLKERIHVNRVEYVPTTSPHRIVEHGKFRNGKSINVLNIYKRPRVEVSNNKTNLLKPFITHIEHLFPTENPVEGEPSNFDLAMNWFAQIVQEPAKRYRTALHSICVNEGMGRGWLVQLLDMIYGDTNVTTVNDMSQVLHDRKNGFLHQSVLTVVNETSVQGVEKYAVSDKLKTMLSDPKQSIDIKYGDQSFGQLVYTRFFSQSNRIDGLMFTNYDTRFIVCVNHGRPKADSYYEKLYKLIERDDYGTLLCPDFVNQVYTYLSNLKINTTWLQRAPDTADKRRIIRENRTETETAFFEMRNTLGNLLFTESVMENFISNFFATHYSSDNSVVHSQPNKKQLEHLVKENLCEATPIKIGSKTHLIRTFGEKDINELNKLQIRKSVVQCKKKTKQYFKQLGESNE